MEMALLIEIFHYSHAFFAREAGKQGVYIFKKFIKMLVSINQRSHFKNLLILEIV